MKEVRITINLENAAFDDVPAQEVARILKELAQQLERSTLSMASVLTDYNGNTVGKCEVVKEYE